MRKIAAFFILIGMSLSIAVAQNNPLLSVKVIPLPEEKLRMDFEFARPLKQEPASFVTQKPARIVLDFIDSNLQIPVDQKTKAVKIGSLNTYTLVAVGSRIRAVLDLNYPVPYLGSISGKVYTLILNGKSNELFKGPKEVLVTHRPVKTSYEVNHFDFRGVERQGGRAIVNLSSTSVPVEVEEHGKEILVKFLNTKIPLQLRKRFDVSDFRSPVKLVTFQQVGKNAHMVLSNKGSFGQYVYQVNKQFMIDVFPLTQEEAQQAKLKKKVFSGRRISLNFQNISIRAVLQLLADFTGLNIVVSDKVQGNITLRLNNIPWDQALDIILTTQGLAKRQTGNVILVDYKATFDKMEAEELKNQNIIQKLEPVRSELIQINYAKATDLAILIKDKQNSLLSDKGKVSVDTRTNTIWIQDSGTKIDEVRDLIKQLDVPVKQVLIEARIVEVTKDFAQDLGIRWGVSKPPHLSGTLAGANQMAQGVAPANVVPFTDRLNLDLVAAPVTGAVPASVGIALAQLGDNILLDLELSALESEGLAELISSPRLITANQQPALIDSGQEIPYQEATSSGATAVAFKKAVLSLKVTPQITPDSKILMELKINQDTASPQLFNGVPSILTKEIQTNVLVSNGQTIVLGGIYQQDKSKKITRVPFFGQLPVVGNLFKNTQISLKNDELLIFITPKIITNSLSITTIEGRKPIRFDEK
ncbi:type IV pilus secretin PilQ family protein [Fluoribacter dumoffii]|uniref:Type IV pilus biogenesis and competence protein pilQ n=1 Tax=Fluoribacter dumoffii TaxID=463 RepID=A0A377G8K8_9GAMM|nr:type IV pilus secretin PilQ [Fluoribacter dumoffii]KTC89729.1 type IV pilus (Tfp) assembly protein PilQ [Fluoribacter dumoffii NY 23]MCW8417985.1 type IV pilus secretin PilQ family protein [Fluoribacter dumoffii]MCW8454173.1 type IV pilus secretin PilQ family protein [Fluoribacter dumoffii]MCW8461753.1 type IV pilus secretin PilQ family protein [Fluoribacter dumoffii]MCW8481969.1 type IV pilus secretin PilQ family protein [Fluoribacter dumoffii]